MKKEARTQALKLYLKHNGKVTNRAIAEQVNVNPLTVGRWKRDDSWDAKLKEKETAVPKEKPAGVVRKKVARDKAFALYMDAGGNITNKDLASKVQVSPATISKWKEADNWMRQAEDMEAKPAVEALVPVEEQDVDTTDLDMGELASPYQIIRINRRIDTLLDKEYLNAGELADLAGAKATLLEAVESYLAIVREVEAMRAKD
jgi:uncharacterized protein YjcR